MFRILICIVGLILGAVQAVAQDRIALVVGNGSYDAVAKLDNPVNDATLIAKQLAGLGFTVTTLTDADQATFQRAVAQFGRDLREAGKEATGLFYYAGHGVQSFGSNYLVPVDASLTDAADLDLVAVEASSVLRQMASARNKANIFILDACRNNPFIEIVGLNDNGLAEMKAPTGSYLAYATAPGEVALDGLDGNSPFTKALASEIQTAGLPIEQVFKRVRVRVIDETEGAQTPWDTSSLTSEFMFKAGVELSAEEVAENQLWDSVRVTRDPVQIMLFLRAYPRSAKEVEARELLAEVMAQEMANQVPAPAAKKPQTVTAPAPQTPDDPETKLIEAARASGSLADYQAYVEAYPEGVFAELARLEIATLTAKAEKEAGPAEVAAAAPEVADILEQVTFSAPLLSGAEGIKGKSIEDLVLGEPLFAPIEGIPEELWKGQQCSRCHEWTREALCTQSKTYLALNAQRSLGKEHPYGGTFKQNLKAWAAGGCQ